MSDFIKEVLEGERFEFGKNWASFLRHLNSDRITAAEKSFKEMLQLETVEGLKFLDIGSGSGLSSLVARRLGAKVVSFDYDPQSIQCTLELKKKYFTNDTKWSIRKGSVLDCKFVESLGQFDISY